jgi:hypothetical protein
MKTTIENPLTFDLETHAPDVWVTCGGITKRFNREDFLSLIEGLKLAITSGVLGVGHV